MRHVARMTSTRNEYSVTLRWVFSCKNGRWMELINGGIFIYKVRRIKLYPHSDPFTILNQLFISLLRNLATSNRNRVV
jgi:hypothetical protein